MHLLFREVHDVPRPMPAKPIEPRRRWGAVKRYNRDWLTLPSHVLDHERQDPLRKPTLSFHTNILSLPHHRNSPEQFLLVCTVRPALMQQLPAREAAFYSLFVSQLTVNEHEDIGSLVLNKR